MLDFPKTKTTEDRLLFFFGLLGTMPILQIFGLTVFTWMTLVLIGYNLLFRLKIVQPSNKSTPYIIFTLLTLISAAVCITSDLPEMWKKIQLTSVVWRLCYLFLFLIYFCKARFDKTLFYIKGVYYASIIHSIWGCIQVLVYEATGQSVNRLIFFDMFHVEAAEYVQMRGGSIAMTGFCWNAGNIAPLLVIGYAMSKSLLLKIFFLMISVLSGSRTAITGVVACFVLEVFLYLLRQYKDRIKLIHIVGFFGALGFLMMVILANGNITQMIIARCQEILSTFSSSYLNTQSSSRLHARYWTSIPLITEWNKPVHNLFGYGLGASGYPFTQLFGQYTDGVWVVECDFINDLWSFGYVGFMTWYLWYAYNMIKGSKVNKRFFILFAGLLVEGASYNVTFNWCLIFLLFVFINIEYSNDFLRLRSLRSYYLKGKGKYEIIRDN
ncbi:MAG: hypothetical protein IKN24_07360 [Lachnospiraceae bacterium]|nr:hypothetical protein [Lachnospiraceae bacterium]